MHDYTTETREALSKIWKKQLMVLEASAKATEEIDNAIAAWILILERYREIADEGRRGMLEDQIERVKDHIQSLRDVRSTCDTEYTTLCEIESGINLAAKHGSEADVAGMLALYEERERAIERAKKHEREARVYEKAWRECLAKAEALVEQGQLEDAQRLQEQAEGYKLRRDSAFDAATLCYSWANEATYRMKELVESFKEEE